MTTDTTSPIPQLLAGKKILITGVLTEASIAFAAAKQAQLLGAEIVLTGAGRAARLTRMSAKRLPTLPTVLDLDVTNEEEIANVVTWVEDNWGRLDGLVHAIAFGPKSCIGDVFFGVPFEDVSTAVHVSTWSYPRLAEAFAHLLAKSPGKGSYVGLTFDASIAWPGYNWMGVAKAGLESANRYLAREIGPQGTRVNLVAAGPVGTVAAKSVAGFSSYEEAWATRAPLGWDLNDATPVGKVICSLLSDYMPMVTGSIIQCDGGVHAVAG